MELKTFCTHFNKCLKLCLEHPESLPCIGVALDFASKFIVSLLEGLGEDETCPFFTSVVHFLFEVVEYIVYISKIMNKHAVSYTHLDVYKRQPVRVSASCVPSSAV